MRVARRSAQEPLSIRHQDSKIAHIVSGRPGDECVADAIEHRVAIEARQIGGYVEAAFPGTFRRSAIGDGACGVAVAVDAVGSGAEDGDVFTGNLFRTIERKLLIAPTYS